MGIHDNFDTYNWTPSFISSNRAECLRILQMYNSTVVELIREKNYIDARKGLKHLTIGLIKMEDENLGDFKKQEILLAMLMPSVSILGFLDTDASESWRRDAALEYAFDMTDDPNHELATNYPIAKDIVWSYIADLRSNVPLAQITKKHKADVFDALASLDRDLSTFSFAPSPSASSHSPSTYSSSSTYSTPSTHTTPSTRATPPSTSTSSTPSKGWAVLLVIIIIGVLAFCARPYITGKQSASSNGTRQTEAPAEETPKADLLYQNGGFIFPNSDSELIDQEEIETLSDRDLTYAINEIYARHGYIFRSAELSEYYGQFSWYAGEVPSNEFSVDCFNQIEQQNWNLLVNERNLRKASD